MGKISTVFKNLNLKDQVYENPKNPLPFPYV